MFKNGIWIIKYKKINFDIPLINDLLLYYLMSWNLYKIFNLFNNLRIYYLMTHIILKVELLNNHWGSLDKYISFERK